MKKSVSSLLVLLFTGLSFPSCNSDVSKTQSEFTPSAFTLNEDGTGSFTFNYTDKQDRSHLLSMFKNRFFEQIYLTHKIDTRYQIMGLNISENKVDKSVDIEVAVKNLGDLNNQELAYSMMFYEIEYKDGQSNQSESISLHCQTHDSESESIVMDKPSDIPGVESYVNILSKSIENCLDSHPDSKLASTYVVVGPNLSQIELDPDNLSEYKKLMHHSKEALQRALIQ